MRIKLDEQKENVKSLCRIVVGKKIRLELHVDANRFSRSTNTQLLLVFLSTCHEGLIAQ
jgi:hypothetical protein